MKKLYLYGALTCVIALLLVFLACSPPVQPPEQALEQAGGEALAIEDLLDNLDVLQGSGARSLTQPETSIYPAPGGRCLSLGDLSSFIGSIKRDFAAYVYSITGSKPYLVRPVKLSWITDGKQQSGLMWIPYTWGRRLDAPVITYLHGTQLYRNCAPSRFSINPLAVLSSPDPTGALNAYVEVVVGALMASTGYIVVMPDYEGFGDSTAIHPYMHMSLGNSARDAVAAAKAVLTGSVRPNGKVFLTGYSEGGYATLVAAKAFQQAGLPVSGVVPCDGAYDISGTMLDQMLSGLPVKVPYYLLYVASGYKATYGNLLDYYLFLRPYYGNLLTHGNPFDGNHTHADIDALGLPQVPADMLLGSPGYPPDSLVPGGSVYNLLAANNGYAGWVPLAPLVFVHCPVDDIVPYQNAVVARSYLIAAAQSYLGPLFNPLMIPDIVDVAPLPLISDAMGETHMAAFPTAVLAAFTAIKTIDTSIP